jgi:hypothetical protein
LEWAFPELGLIAFVWLDVIAYSGNDRARLAHLT